jgi:hypothetical protein
MLLPFSGAALAFATPVDLAIALPLFNALFNVGRDSELRCIDRNQRPGNR